MSSRSPPRWPQFSAAKLALPVETCASKLRPPLAGEAPRTPPPSAAGAVFDAEGPDQAPPPELTPPPVPVLEPTARPAPVPEPILAPDPRISAAGVEAREAGADGAREPAEGAAGGSALLNALPFSLALWPALALEEGAAVVAVDDVDVFGA